MIVCIGLDDNDNGNGAKWFLDFIRPLKNRDGSPARCTFFMSTRAQTVPLQFNEPLKETIRTLLDDGHELACHGSNHAMCNTKEEWDALIGDAITDIREAGFDPSVMKGFRSPYLIATPAMFESLSEFGFKYDSSTQSEDIWSVHGVYTIPISKTLTDSVAVDYSMLIDVKMTVAQMVGMLVRLKGEIINVGFHPNMWSDDGTEEVQHSSTVAQRREAVKIVIHHWISQHGVWLSRIGSIAEALTAEVKYD